MGDDLRILTGRRLAAAAACWAVAVLAPGPGARPACAQYPYQTLDYGTSGTFLTGIRGESVVGNDVISGGTGGLLYDLSSGVWTPFPVATASGANFPGASSSSPYGPGFGSIDGILRVVGSYKTAGSPYDLSYLYDAATAPANHITSLVYPSLNGAQTLDTIAHSTFGNQVVGNYDTNLVTGNAFVYTISTGTYATNDHPGSVSTTAYGVWGDKIAGGYFQVGPGGGPAFEHGYIYNETTGAWATYDHPGAVFTHFEGITSGGRAGSYNLVADWSGVDGTLHTAVLHIGADGSQTWYDYTIPGAASVSANSAYQNEIIGIYVTPGGAINGYLLTIPGIYTPVQNAGLLVAGTANAVALAGADGDDVVNSGDIRATGVGSVGLRSGAYGVVTNSGSIAATGAGAAGVLLDGAYGTLLNEGRITAAPGADAIRTGATALGTAIVNDGVIDGRVAVTAGPLARFENNGWMGVSGPGWGVGHVISGTFAQTPAGVLAVRVGAGGADTVTVGGSAVLAGTLMPVFQAGGLARSYTILTTGGGYSGQFGSVTPLGLPGFVTESVVYGSAAVGLSLTSNLGRVGGLTANQTAVAGVLDAAFNGSGGSGPGSATGSVGGVPGDVGAVYGAPASVVPGALNALSGELYASEQTVLIDQALFAREAVLGRLRQISHAGQDGPEAAFGLAGPSVAAADGSDGTHRAALQGLTFWSQAFGSWGNLTGDGNASSVSETFAGVMLGADALLTEDWRVGGALGYAHANADASALSSSAMADTGLIGAYAARDFGRVAVRAGGTYGFSSVNTTRSIVLPGVADSVSAGNSAGTGQVFGEAGYGLAWNAIAFEPFAGLAWVHLGTTGFTEDGAAGLSGSGVSRDVGYASLGVRAATRYALANGMTVVPRAYVAWQHALGPVVPTESVGLTAIRGGDFSVSGVPLARDAALVDAGIDLRISARAKAGLSYFGQLAGGAHDNAVTGSFTWAF